MKRRDREWRNGVRMAERRKRRERRSIVELRRAGREGLTVRLLRFGRESECT